MGSEEPMTGVVLAGGGSTRFTDGHKALATLDGDPLLLRVSEAVRAGTDRTPVLAFRTEDQRQRLGSAVGDVRTRFDDSAFSGPLAGLYGALDAVDTPWLFLCACDMPLVSPAAIRFLADRRADEVDAVVPIGASGDPEPLHALYRRAAVACIRDEVTPAAGVRALPSQFDEVASVPVGDAPAGVDLEASTTNVNTRAALARLER
ncbi:molybdenum cofactor guanylyltransferase [Haloarchaeobius sp. HRN-SO-5]|uniref:molybdenum cofactor guanylyltransferase n=1 Tax=Haloarchaeobius sp. HRN-SO-5 TaxID=3446118 RepID=UPI003EBC5F84